MSDYSHLSVEESNSVINAYSKVTESLIGITYPCPEADKVINDIKKAESEDNSLTHSDDLSQLLEEDYPEAGKLVREYFKNKLPFGDDVEDYKSR